MSVIECIADRFVRTDRGRAIDLATGETVRIVMAPAGTPVEQVRWTAACDERYAAASSDDEALVDYGRCGEASRFEAWGAPRIVCPEHRIEAGLAELFDGGSARSRL